MCTSFAELDIVISGAGAYVPKTIRDLSFNEFILPFKLDLGSAFLLTKYSLPYLEKSKENLVYISAASSMDQ